MPELFTRLLRRRLVVDSSSRNATHSSIREIDDDPTNAEGFANGFLAGLGVGVFLAAGVFLTLTLLGTYAFAKQEDSERRSGLNHNARSVKEIREDISAFIKNSKQDEDLSLQVGAVLDLCQIHHELVNDPRFHVGQQFKGLRARVATRLKAYQKDLKVELKRRKRIAERMQRLAIQAERRSGTASEEVNQSTKLASSDTMPSSVESEVDDDSRSEWDGVMNQSVYEMGILSGGPSQLFGYLGGNYAPPWDYGEDLVNLIEHTISPDSWLRNGGNGRIQYYRPSMIIVVSASMRVHDEMTDLLRQLRFLSR